MSVMCCASTSSARTGPSPTCAPPLISLRRIPEESSFRETTDDLFKCLQLSHVSVWRLRRSDEVRWSLDVRFEDASAPTESGTAMGFGLGMGVEEWLAKWDDMPLGSY